MHTNRASADAAAGAAIDDCWNHIGIHGDSSCALLKTHVHCRNCPVYSAAAMRLLDEDLPEDYRATWTAHVARENSTDEAGMHSIVVFRLDGEWLALPTTIFEEIAGMRTIHTLPHRSRGVVLGLANVRGELRACVSLKQLLGLRDVPATAEKKPQASLERLLVARYEGNPVAFPVDEVHGIHRFHARDLHDKPATLALAAATYTKAVLSWRQNFVGVLDERLLFPAINRSLASATVT